PPSVSLKAYAPSCQPRPAARLAPGAVRRPFGGAHGGLGCCGREEPRAASRRLAKTSDQKRRTRNVGPETSLTCLECRPSNLARRCAMKIGLIVAFLLATLATP